MKTKRWSIVLVVVIVVLALIGCLAPQEAEPVVEAEGGQEPAPVEDAADPEVEEGAPLVKVFRHGGLCMTGAECEWEMVIAADGSYIIRDGGGEASEGVLPVELVAAIQAAIAEADFAAIKSVPFTETCPVAYDGQEVIYTFYAEGGAEEIASCDVQIDPAHPLFAAVEAAVAVAQ